MGSYSFSFLPLDYTRCMGEGCNRQKHCARFLQLEKDKVLTGPYKASVIHTLIDKETDECSMRIEL